MQFNKFIIRPASPLIIFTLIFLAIGVNGDSEDILSPAESTPGSSRDSKQLFSILKTFLQQGQKVSKQPEEQQQYQNQNLYQQHPYYNYNQQYPPLGASYTPAEQKIHVAGGTVNPNYPSQYPLQNYQLQQHSSVPFYNENLQLQAQEKQHQQQFIQQQQLQQIPGGIGALGGSPSGTSINPIVLSQGANLLSKLGLGSLGIPEDLDLSTVGNLINFGAFEGMLGRVNQFDKLQCIPRMICQMVAKRNEDQAVRDSTSTTTSTTTTTERSRSSTKKPKKRTREDSARFIKIGGVDTALEQFVGFLDLMQLKDWSIYPYIKGMHEGNKVQRSGDCAQKFNSCPFSDDQLVYYFNNYNGGLFQSFRSGRDLLDLNLNNIVNSTISARNESLKLVSSGKSRSTTQH